MKSVCRSCGAPVLWVLTEEKRAMPVDRDPAPNGNVEILREEDGYTHVRYYSPADAKPSGVPMHLSHFATCPQAAEWRKRKKGRR